MAVGEFYSALTTEDDNEFSEAHLRWDLDIDTIDLSQREGDFAMLTVVCVNDGAGALNPSTEQWLWLAWEDEEGAVPLLFGRVVAVPTDLNKAILQYTFRARSTDFRDQKADLADTLKVAPFWDPVMTPPESMEDPDFVLQARTQSWHIDRLTHEVSVSDNITGEDGALAYGGDDIEANSTTIRIGSAAVSRVRVDAELNWTQRAVGVIDAAPPLVRGFKNAGSDGTTISSYTMDGLIETWPLPGDNIGAGWAVNDSDLDEGTGKWVSPQTALVNQMSVWVKNNSTSNQQFTSSIGSAVFQDQTKVNYTMGTVKPTMELGYDAERSFTEHVTFTLSADVQAILTEPEGADERIMTFSSNDAAEPVDTIGDPEYGVIPIGDVRRRSYVQTDRGLETVMWLVARARAELLDNARAVEIDVTLPFREIVNITLRMNATITDARLPGGTATGKVVAYRATGDGSSGAFTLVLTIACCVGKGGLVVDSLGVPVYIEDAYIAYEYQVHIGNAIMVAGDVTWSDDFRNIPPADDGVDFINFRPEDYVQAVIVTNGVNAQRTALAAQPTPTAGIGGVGTTTTLIGTPKQTVADTVNDLYTNNFTTVCMQMKPLNTGPFLTELPVTVSQLMVPMGINLEAGYE